MARAIFLFIIINESLTKDIFQPNLMLVAQTGQNVNLTCRSPKTDFKSIAWFKQNVGQKPEFIVGSFRLSTNYRHYGGFDPKRFVLQKEGNMFNLYISKINALDSALYYCAFVNTIEIQFAGGTFLNIEELTSNSRTVMQQPVSDLIYPGDSVTLNCTVDSETCAGKHSVYWFRHGSGESLPGLLYTLGNRSDECEKSPEARSPIHSCVYSLPKRNLSRSDAGTYYCAVVTCGEILFGNGTQLDIEGCGVSPAFIGMGIVLTFSAILNFALICTRNYRKLCDHCTDQKNHHDTSTKDLEASEKDVADTLNYAALHFNNKNYKSARKKRELKEETVYSSVSSHAWE